MTMLVAYVLSRYVQPSQTFVTNEIAELRRQGVAVTVVSVEHGDRPPAPGDDVLFLADVPRDPPGVLFAHLAVALRRPWGYLRFLLAVRALHSEMGTGRNQVPWKRLPLVARSLQARGVDVLHAHFAWSGAAAALLLAHLTGLRWSMTVHANDIFSLQRNLDVKLRAVDRLVTVCRYNVDWMREHLGLRRSVDVVICGVEPPVEGERSIAGADLVTVGRLVPKKGFDTLLQAVALLRQTHDVTLDIVGDGRDHDALARQVDELGLGEFVRLLGARSHTESLARIAGARVFCLPARVAADGDRDSMPVVIKEAMARGVPVVASDAVAIPEMLADDCGVMVPPDDPAALAAALASVLDDEEWAATLAANARQRVESQFALAGEVGRLRAILSEVAFAPARGPATRPRRLRRARPA